MRLPWTTVKNGDYLLKQVDADHKARRDRAMRLLSEARNGVRNQEPVEVTMGRIIEAELLVERL